MAASSFSIMEGFETGEGAEVGGDVVDVVGVDVVGVDVDEDEVVSEEEDRVFKFNED
jgi:hypothetical protein